MPTDPSTTPGPAATDGDRQAPEAGRDEGGRGSEADLDALPGQIRERVLHWAAGVLGGLPVEQIPPSLTRVARFTPAKRARTGAAALTAALRSDPGFRAAVLERLARLPATDQDATDAAALAVLHRRADWPDLVAQVRRSVDAAAVGAEADRLRVQVARLSEQVRELSEQVRDRPVGADRDELDRLRQRLREQGVRVRTAERAAADAESRRLRDAAEWGERVAAAEHTAQAEQERAAAAQELADRAQLALAGLRESANRTRTASDRRLELLLLTVEGAAAGLRREWALQGGGLDPADALAAGWPERAVPAEATADPARLQAWLGQPGAHLIVDGYNVSKSGFAEQTLAVQRDRVVRGLAGLGARTGAETTVIFDGGAVPVPPVVPQAPGRRTRILFSPPGVIADDVIVDLVAAEPAGRVVVVVTSDREVVRRVGRHGAKTAGAAVLLTLLGV